jgi:uncharacterized membrane protein YfcA
LIDSIPLWLPVAFFLVALIYSAAGFGGGSAYLAVLAFSSLPYQAIPQTSLLCNLVVSAGGVWFFHRAGHLELKRVLPFFVLSIPLSYVGGRIVVGKELFYVLLAVTLLTAGFFMVLPRAKFGQRTMTRTQEWALGLPLGAGLGLVSGMVGIGGGVFLAPALLVFGWTTPKQTAAAASLFILLNSLFAMIGQSIKGLYLGWITVPLVLAALVGGQIGSRAGSYWLSGTNVRRVLAAIIIAVGLRMLWKAI